MIKVCWFDRCLLIVLFVVGFKNIDDILQDMVVPISPIISDNIVIDLMEENIRFLALRLDFFAYANKCCTVKNLSNFLKNF